MMVRRRSTGATGVGICQNSKEGETAGALKAHLGQGPPLPEAKEASPTRGNSGPHWRSADQVTSMFSWAKSRVEAAPLEPGPPLLRVS